MARRLERALSDDSTHELEVRRAMPEDLPGILELARRSLGWNGDDDDARFFSWKHFENPVGASPTWLALDGDRIVGLRAFMRWQFGRAAGGVVPAVRAVDTATDPDYQGRGIFRMLTLQAVDELRDDGVALIFNTPNSKSMPGYLKMGWEEVGRLPTMAQPTRLGSIPRLAGARAPAQRTSIEMRVGESPADVFGDAAAVDQLFERVHTPTGLTTVRTHDYLGWRYGFDPLHYRVALNGSTVEHGLAVFRLRRRGGAIEAAVCDVMVPRDEPSAERALMREIRNLTGADYLLRIDPRLFSWGFARVPRTGPTLVCRSLDGRKVPRLDEVDFSLGDVELF